MNMMQQGRNMPMGMSTAQQGMGMQNTGMQQQSMDQMACTTMDEFDHAMQMWSQVLQGAQGCPDVEAEARAQLGALETWRNALAQTMSRAQSADPNTQQLAQRDLIQTCSKAHTAVMRAEQTFMQEYGSAQDQALSDIGMGNLMGGRGMGMESQFGQQTTGSQSNQPWQQQQYQAFISGHNQQPVRTAAIPAILPEQHGTAAGTAALADKPEEHEPIRCRIPG